MRIRPYISALDFDIIKNWITDERGHSMWCADMFGFPLEKDNFDGVLSELSQKYHDSGYVATADDGEVIGFFCYGVNLETNEGMLKFIMVDKDQRGRGIGREMLTLAVKYAFDITKAEAVQLNVFSVNEKAKKCYESVGFCERKYIENGLKFKNENWGKSNMVIYDKR